MNWLFVAGAPAGSNGSSWAFGPWASEARWSGYSSAAGTCRRGCSNWAWADPPPPGCQVTSSFTSSVKHQQILMLMLSRAVPDQFPVSVSGFHEGVQS